MPKTLTMKKSFFNVIPSDGECAILLYGDVGDYGKVDSGRVVSELMTLSSLYNKIDVRINSCGGDVFSGIAIYTALKNSKADITIYIDGVAASIAGVIALCGKPLYMSPYAKLMLHSVSGGTYGNASELRQMADTMEQLQNHLAEMISGKMKLTKEEILARYFDEKDHWITAPEALEMGLIEGIYNLAGEVPEAIPNTTEEIYNYFNNRLNKPQTPTNMSLLESIKILPTFKNVADEAGIVAKIKEIENENTRLKAEAAAVSEYKKQLNELRKKEVENFVNQAVADKKITAEQAPQFVKLMESDRATTEAILNSMKPQGTSARAVDVIDTAGGANASLENKSWDELDRAGKLAELKNQNIALFQAKYKEKFGVDYKE